ncbi:MAG: guanosine-3',5'-bis(diphosphate) 3'-pyrophosphohydrolase, partial [Aquificota bacterium]|nr:guanosine-3',5'-bis(diphosphate) 3'-pyrophosphohydrolase [Aquificota bacterium]
VSVKKEEDLLIALGSGRIPPERITSLISPKRNVRTSRDAPEGRGEVSVEDLGSVLYDLGKCCNPVPGDEVYGVVTRGKGIVLHEKNCTNLRYLMENFPEKVLKVRWKPSGKFRTRIRVRARDRIGILSEIARKIAENDSSIWESVTKVTGEEAVMDFTIDVADRKHLFRIIRSIKTVDGVEGCSRVYS